ncbi:MAG: IS5 family transposase [Candidatus Omnitrophota bacterium]
MVVADGKGIPLGVSLHSASPHEVTLADKTLETLGAKPEHLVCDKGYDSDVFRSNLEKRGIELVAPHRENRRKPKTQDGRALRRYKRRWKIERTIAWLGNYRRLVTRWERNDRMYQAFLHIACALITCNSL